MFILIVIAAGILSRKTPLIPLIVGDLLYAVMMFLIIRFLFIRLSYLKTAFISLSICYLIELSQLYDATWFNSIRNTTFGGLVLGHGFLWGDMAAYTLGTAICVMLFQKIKPFTPVN
ncbi:Protein of unknown function [Pedobacter caeni]|uniref:DUF2809 domain-containing protein n=1 Tax=Pedobacter caeni TaxID=288992 RepID=A0A1M4U6K8_9SPHI|nr:Protein of unknown function [Pedobacter caeni]